MVNNAKNVAVIVNLVQVKAIVNNASQTTHSLTKPVKNKNAVNPLLQSVEKKLYVPMDVVFVELMLMEVSFVMLLKMVSFLIKESYTNVILLALLVVILRLTENIKLVSLALMDTLIMLENVPLVPINSPCLAKKLMLNIR